jgi:hypothetical protein
MMRNMLRHKRFLLAIPLMACCAAFIALGGVSSAASSAKSVSRTSTTTTRHKSPDLINTASGLTRAYALVIPGCGGCAKRRPGFTPLVRTQSRNIALGAVRTGAPIGTWCFIATNGVYLSGAIVVTNAVNTGGPYTNHFSLENAEWILGSPDCMPNQIEIQTSGYLVESGRMVAVPDRETAFSFSVDAQ